MDKSRPFIIRSPLGRWEISKDASDFLCNVKEPLAAVAVIGQQGGDKPSLLESLAANRHESYTTTRARGIYLQLIKDPNNCLLLDCQFNLDDEDEQERIQLFTLALLLSKLFVFNSVESKEKDFIHELQFISDLPSLIQTGGDDPEIELAACMPSLYIVLWDTKRSSKIDGNEVLEEDYLEHILVSKDGYSKRVVEYNSTRQCIRCYFPNRNLSLIPVSSQTLTMPRSSSTAAGSRRPHEIATSKLIQKIKTESNDSRFQMNGQQYLQMAAYYVQCVNNHKTPCIKASLLKYVKPGTTSKLDPKINQGGKLNYSHGNIANPDTAAMSRNATPGHMTSVGHQASSTSKQSSARESKEELVKKKLEAVSPQKPGDGQPFAHTRSKRQVQQPDASMELSQTEIDKPSQIKDTIQASRNRHVTSDHRTSVPHQGLLTSNKPQAPSAKESEDRILKKKLEAASPSNPSPKYGRPSEHSRAVPKEQLDMSMDLSMNETQTPSENQDRLREYEETETTQTSLQEKKLRLEIDILEKEKSLKDLQIADLKRKLNNKHS